MKQLTFKFVVPLTVISFGVFTKWWYALPVDAPDTMFTGFPFPFACPGWHTSLSWQIFVLEFVADLLIYFLFWFLVVWSADRYLIKLRLPRLVVIGLWVASILIVSFWSLLAVNKENIFTFKRSFDMDVKATGYRFAWQEVERPMHLLYGAGESKGN